LIAASIQDPVAWLRRCTAELQRQIDDHIDSRPQLRQDAEVTTPNVLAFLGDARSFKKFKGLAAFVRETTRLKESRGSERERST
jgi:hypothetical protein